MVHFTEQNRANPRYLEDQKGLLSYLCVKPAKESMPPDLYKLMEENTNIEEPLVVDVDDNTIYMNRGRNDIFVIEKLRNIPPKTENDKNDRHEIVDLFYVDLQSGMAFDVSILWKIHPPMREGQNSGKNTVMVVRTEGFASSGYCPDGAGGLLVLNRLGEKTNEVKIGENVLVGGIPAVAFIDQYLPFHETAHRFQDHPHASIDQSAFSLLELILYQKVLPEIPWSAKIMNYFPKLRKGLEKHKIMNSQMERNATAFALTAIRTLRDHGLNLTRGMNNKDIMSNIDMLLETYDMTYQYVTGPAISQKQKKKMSREE